MGRYFLYEWHQQSHHKVGLWLPIGFFILLNLITPFTLPNNDLQGGMGQSDFILSLLWIGLLLCYFLGTEHLFLEDKKKHLTDFYRLYAVPLEAIFLVKVMVFFILRTVGLLLVLPLIALLWHIPIDILGRFMAMLLVSAPAIVFFIGFGSLLLALLEENHFLIFLLVFPLIIPAIIFAATGCYAQTPLLDNIPLPFSFSVLSVCITTFASPSLLRLLQDS